MRVDEVGVLDCCCCCTMLLAILGSPTAMGCTLDCCGTDDTDPVDLGAF